MDRAKNPETYHGTAFVGGKVFLMAQKALQVLQLVFPSPIEISNSYSEALKECNGTWRGRCKAFGKRFMTILALFGAPFWPNLEADHLQFNLPPRP